MLKKVFIAPRPGGGLQHASARLDSPYGTIASAWRLESDTIHVALDIPANTTADFVFPGSVGQILRDGKPVAKGSGVEGTHDVHGRR